MPIEEIFAFLLGGQMDLPTDSDSRKVRKTLDAA
jgi:hypothetical protein